MLSKAALSTIFQVFGMTRPRIESWFPGLLANTLLLRPIKEHLMAESAVKINQSIQISFDLRGAFNKSPDFFCTGI